MAVKTKGGPIPIPVSVLMLIPVVSDRYRIGSVSVIQGTDTTSRHSPLLLNHQIAKFPVANNLVEQISNLVVYSNILEHVNPL